MKVQFFQGVNPYNLQDKINDWLDQNKNIAVGAIIQSQLPGEKNKPGPVTISLWYSENSGPPPGHGQGRPIFVTRRPPPGPPLS